MAEYPLGKLPAGPLSKKAIMFDDVFDMTKMPAMPTSFTYDDRIKSWYTYGNDEYGDCVWAAKAHMHMLWPVLGGYGRNYLWTRNVLSDYAAATGFRADDPSTDQGTDMRSAAEYHRKTGIRDSRGERQRVEAYVNMIPGNLDQLAMATYVFGAVELGVLVTADNMKQFDRNEPWTVTADHPMGGHCLPCVGRDADGNFLCITWGRIAKLSSPFVEKYMDEAITYLDTQILNKVGLSPGAFDKATLMKMLAKVSPQPVIRTAEEIAAAEIEANPEVIRYGLTSSTTANAFPTDEQFEAAFKLMGEFLDNSGYSWAISKDKLKPFADQIAIAVVAAGPKQEE